jgi:hypothetical protein
MNVWRIFWLGMIAIAAVACVMALATKPTPAQQAAPCAPAEAMLRWLQERYREAPHMRMRAGSAIYIAKVSDEGTGSVLRTQGIDACMISSGTDATMEAGI